MTFLSRFGRNLGTLLLAFMLAVVVWVSAVVSSDPNEERIYPRQVQLAVEGKDAGLVILGDLPNQVRLTLNAPQTVWTQLTNNPSALQAWIDLTGRGPGEHSIPVKSRVVGYRPVQIVQTEPETVRVRLEQLVTEKMPVNMIINGDPPLGYLEGEAVTEPISATVSGPASVVQQVSEVQAVVNISGARDTRRENVTLQAINETGNVIIDSHLVLSPKNATVTIPITLESRYKNVVVRVATTGQLAEGYRLTNISVTPLNITLVSSNLQLLNELPGYVDTQPVDLTGLSDDAEIRVNLNLPEEVSAVGTPSVLVQISVAANEGSRVITIPVEYLGLTPDLQARVSPPVLDIIVTGPLPVLENLTPASFRAVVSLSGLEPGIYHLRPNIDLLPDQVQVLSTIPETVEVVIVMQPTPTPSATPPVP